MKPKHSVRAFVDRLILLTVLFYGGGLGASVSGLVPDKIVDALLSGGTLALGAVLGIIKEETDDDDVTPPPVYTTEYDNNELADPTDLIK